MPKLKQRWVYIDERPEDRENFGLLLSATGELEITAAPPDPSMACLEEWIRENKVDGYLLDYKLSEGDSSIHSTGATWATEIRQRLPDRPIVILSGRLRASVMQSTLVNHLIPAVDLDLRKRDVSQDHRQATKTLLALGDGYSRISAALTAACDVKQSIRSILGLGNRVHEEQAGNVIGWLAVGISTAGPALRAGIPTLAKRILGELMTFPGVLLPQSNDRRWASSFLGITPAAFAAIAAEYPHHRYSGVFCDIPGPLYWSHSLERLTLDTTNVQYCQLCRKNPSITCCANCERPIDGQHSLPGSRLTAELQPNHRVRLCGACLNAGDIEDGLALDHRHAPRLKSLLDSIEVQTET